MKKVCNYINPNIVKTDQISILAIKDGSLYHTRFKPTIYLPTK